jgi:tRNA-specific 2-thiouridylase
MADSTARDSGVTSAGTMPDDVMYADEVTADSDVADGAANANEVATDDAVTDDAAHTNKASADSAAPQGGRHPRVLVAMSGGVDSSVAALLLKEQGYDCVGVTMRLYDNALVEGGAPEVANAKTCCSLDDIADAREVAQARLGIPHVVLDCHEQFAESVIDPFVESYLTGRTPNPCIACNRYLKFEHLFAKARELDCDYVATGHYARILSPDDACGRWRLVRARDANKDQSYVLYALDQERLSHVLLPLGDFTKPEVRKIAERHGFSNARKRESQDICFIPDGDYVGFLERYTGVHPEPGDVLDADGRVLGQHRGAVHYTIGQRKGIGIAAKTPLYVTDKDMAANTVTVGPVDELLSRGCIVDDWIDGAVELPLGRELPALVKTHYRQKALAATVERLGDGTVRVTYNSPARKAAPGQACVAYTECGRGGDGAGVAGATAAGGVSVDVEPSAADGIAAGNDAAVADGTGTLPVVAASGTLPGDAAVLGGGTIVEAF